MKRGMVFSRKVNEVVEKENANKRCTSNHRLTCAVFESQYDEVKDENMALPVTPRDIRINFFEVDIAGGSVNQSHSK